MTNKLICITLLSKIIPQIAILNVGHDMKRAIYLNPKCIYITYLQLFPSNICKNGKYTHCLNPFSDVSTLHFVLNMKVNKNLRKKNGFRLQKIIRRPFFNAFSSHSSCIHNILESLESKF